MKNTLETRPNTDVPKMLLRLKRRHSYQEIADMLGVNVKYVYDAVAHGKCPSNPRIAEQLGFNVQRVRFGDERRKHIRWWKRSLSAQKRNQLIFLLWCNREEA